MTVLGSLLVSAVALVITAALADVCRRRQLAYFGSYVARFGRPPRARPRFRLGFGLDEFTFGWWDYAPAWTALRHRTSDSELERQRRAALLSTVAFYVELPASAIAVAFVAQAWAHADAFSATALVAIGWGVLGRVALRHGLWFSRPELEDGERFAERASVTTAAVLGALLFIVGIVVATALFLTRR